MAQVFTIPPRTLSGTILIPSTKIPTGMRTFVLDFDRSAWIDPTILMDAAFEVSFDGGTIWEAAGGFGGGCGNNVIGEAGDWRTRFTWTWRQSSNATTFVRGTLTITGGSIPISGGFLEMTP